MTAEMAHTYLAEICYDAGNMRAALNHIERAIQLSRKMGLANRELFDLNWMCFFQFVQGNIEECERLVERGRYLLKLTDSAGSAILGFHLVEAVWLYGKREIAQGLELLYDTYEHARQAQNFNFLVLSTQYLVECLIEEGKWKEAEQILSKTLQIVGQESGFIFYSFLVRIFSQQNNPGDAHTMLEKARVAAGPTISFWDQYYLSFAEATLASREQRWDEAWKHFDNAYGLAAQCGARWYEALILRNRAKILLERGEADDQSRARDLLEKTLGLYQKMHLPAWARLVENRLQEIPADFK